MNWRLSIYRGNKMKGTQKNKNTDGMKEGSRQYNDQLVRIERKVVLDD